MKDVEYLKQAIVRGYLCPKCHQAFLQFDESVGGVCPSCGEDFPSWILFSSSLPGTWAGVEEHQKRLGENGLRHTQTTTRR